MSRRALARVLGAGIALAALGACGAPGPASAEASPAGHAVLGPAGTEPAPRPTTADDVRAQGTPSGVCGLRVLSPGPAPTTEATGVGAERWTWAAGGTAEGGTPAGGTAAGGTAAGGTAAGEAAAGETTAGETAEVALLAAPTGAAFEVQDDGSVVVRGGEGVVLCGIAPLTRGEGEVRAADLLAIHGPGEAGEPGESGEPGPAGEVSVWVGAVGAESATWGENEGGRSLAVVPSAWARAAGSAGIAVVWRDLVSLAPDDATPGMQDQLVCHAIGAPDKASWNLEPWRPDVGLLAVLVALCNPE